MVQAMGELMNHVSIKVSNAGTCVVLLVGTILTGALYNQFYVLLLFPFSNHQARLEATTCSTRPCKYTILRCDYNTVPFAAKPT